MSLTRGLSEIGGNGHMVHFPSFSLHSALESLKAGVCKATLVPLFDLEFSMPSPPDYIKVM